MFRQYLLPKYKEATDEQLKQLGYAVLGFHERNIEKMNPQLHHNFKVTIQPIEFDDRYEQRQFEKFVRDAGKYSDLTIEEIIKRLP